MKILIIGAHNDRKRRLIDLITEHYPGYNVIDQVTLESSVLNHTNEENRLIITLLSDQNTPLIQALMQLEEQRIPILIVEEEENIFLEEYLNYKHVKGFLQKHTSLENIKKGINMVLDGGVYKEPSPYKKNPESKVVLTKENKNLEVDWTILSMHSKGFTLEETSEVLEISPEAVKKKLDKIQSKRPKIVPIMTK